MKDGFIKDVYLTLQGNLTPGAAVTGVRDLFAEGSLCDKAYIKLYDAERRLEQRLGAQEHDTDVEEIICALLEISEEMCFWMYCYGAQFGMPKE